jgi:hypothetical protein
MLHGGARAPVIFEKARQFNLQNVAIYRCRDVLLSEEKDQRVHGELLIWALFSYQILPQISLCKKKIPHHIKMPANAWSTKCR